MKVIQVMKVMQARKKRATARPLAFITFIAFIFVTAPQVLAAEARYPSAVPGYAIRFPHDDGSHPAFRTEWWYVTGWLKDERGIERGFQVTFFRNRVGLDEDNPSRFAAKQLLFAHAAISDPSRGRLLNAERSARAGFGLAEAEEGRLAVHVDDWRLRRDEDGVYSASVATDAFALDLVLRAQQPPLLQGDNGFSQKGPDGTAASYYYSVPHLRVSGDMRIGGRRHRVTGSAWFDHEWSSRLLDEAAVGWNWIAINLADGGAVAAGQVRNAHDAEHWAAGSFRAAPEAPVQRFSLNDVSWMPGRRWRSPRTGIEYPVEWRVTLGDRTFTIEPMMEDQESDARASTGTIYWEGAVRAFDERGEEVGKGYLEMTGYRRR